TSGHISTGSDKCKLEPTSNGYFDGTVRYKSGMIIGEPAVSPPRCSISSAGALTTQTTIDAVGNITSQGNISSLGSISAGTTLSASGTISTSRNITASAGAITGKTLAITRTSGRPQTPTDQGCYIGQSSSGDTTIELVSGVGTTYQTYLDFTEPNVDYKGRIILHECNQ
ncbi:MAG: hypothetical protein ACKPKO_50455, partial [Candidatus Fonsibacter sp.]